MNIPKIIHIALFLPGYVFLACFFFFPTEWGKNRNVALSGRQWRYRKWFAPIHSIWIYALMASYRAEFLAVLVQNNIISYDTALKLMN